MELREIADAIGIGKYPPILDEIYATTPQTDTPACDLAMIDELQETWNMFGDYYELVRAVAVQINADPYRSAWIKNSIAFAKPRIAETCKSVPAPKADGTVVTAMLPLYILIGLLPSGIESYKKRGFSDEEIMKLMASIRGGMRIVKHSTGMPGIDGTYYNWLLLFAKAVIFKAEGLQFELRQLPKSTAYIKNKQTGQVLTLMNAGKVHRSGLQMLGSEGYEDEEGAFEVAVREDEQNFYGYPCVDYVISTTEQAFPKSQWESFLRPGDQVMSIHLPRGTDLSEEAIDRCFDAGFKMAAERYPDFNCNAIYCYSWLLDPHLVDILGPESKISKFLKRFILFPPKASGDAVFMFVFDGKPADLKDLEETTSLHRKLKKLYLEGGCIHPYAGIVVR